MEAIARRQPDPINLGREPWTEVDVEKKVRENFSKDVKLVRSLIFHSRKTPKRALRIGRFLRARSGV